MPPESLHIPAIPGEFTIGPGQWADYLALERFHYCPTRPATCAGVWTIRHRRSFDQPTRPVAVAVLSYPAPRGRFRQMMMRDLTADDERQLAFANAHLRTISRVIVHPQFRGIGLATILVRCVLRDCPTRFVEAIARMGHVHPFFERAGMVRIDSHQPNRPAHFLFDRQLMSPTHDTPHA